MIVCGLFAFAGANHADIEVMEELATLAATRGPHSHGFAFVGLMNTGESVDDEGDTEIHFEPVFVTHRDEGDATGAIPLLQRVQYSSIIGHSRLATTGTYAGGSPRIEDTMPFVVDETAIVHNGNVRNYRAIAETNNYTLDSGCDSEVIAHMLSGVRSTYPSLPLTAQLSIVMEWLDDGRPFVVIAINLDGEVAAMRRELPLFVINREEGTYLCSREPDREDATIEPMPEMAAWGFPGVMVRA